MTTVTTPSDENKTVTGQQAGKIGDLLAAQLRSSGLSSAAVQRVIETRGSALAADLAATVRKHVEALEVLTHRGVIEVMLPFDLNPAKYYRNEARRVYVWGGFRQNGDLLKRARPLQAGTAFRLNVWDITAEGGATDAQFETALGANHLFDATTICGFYAAMIAAQPDGEEGHLLNTGYANLAYLSGCVANVSRSVETHWWNAETWARDDDRWDRGGRVFSPAN